MNDLGQLVNLAQQQITLENLKKAKEEELDVVKKNLRHVSESQIPELMEELELSEFKTEDGFMITIKENIHASIPKDNKLEAFGWLRDHGHAGLIKRTIKILFGKGEDEEATKLRDKLIAQRLNPVDESNVHASTLKSFCKKQLESGKELPEELFGVHRVKVSKIKI